MMRRGRGRRLSWWLASVAVVLAGAARAQQPTGQVKAPAVVFEDAQLFHPATDPSRFVSVYDTRNLDPGRYTLGLYANYGLNPIELELEASNRFSSHVVRSVAGADLVAALGLTPKLQLGLDVPYIHTQTRRVFNNGARIQGGGDFLGDVYAEAKYTVLPRPVGQGFGLSLLPRIVFPSGDRERFAGTGRVGWGGLLLGDARFNKINYGLNLGYMVRDQPGPSGGGDEFDDQLMFGVGVTVPTTKFLDLVGEVNGRTAFRNSRSNPTEALLAFRFHWGELAFTVGAGAGLIDSRGAPTVRVMASLTPYIPEKEPPIPMPEFAASSRKTWKLAEDVDKDGRPSPGDTIEYSVNLVNTGTKAAEDVVFVDPIPDRTAYVPGSLVLQGKPLTDAADADAGDFSVTRPGAVTVKIGTVGIEPANNAVAFSFRVKIDPEITEPTVIRNVAQVTHKDRPGGELLPVTETTVFPSVRERETVVVTPEKLELTRNIHFEFDKATIRAESFPVLDDVAGVLKENPQLHILIQGHTDAVGGVAYNQKLSERRADSVRRYLISKGTAPARLAIEGKGKLAPIASNDTSVGRAMNRRVEFLIVNPEVLKNKRIEKRPFIEDIAPESEPASVAIKGEGGGPPTGDRATLEAQQALTTLGYISGEVAGIMDSRTASAIKRFQRENGLPVTGTPNALTRKALEEAIEIQRSR